MSSQHYAETVLHMLNDPKFASYQNFDPDLLWQLQPFENFPDDVQEFCFHITKSGTEPYFEDVLTFTRHRYMEELDKELKKKKETKKQVVKV